jgi:hypothetical protein
MLECNEMNEGHCRSRRRVSMSLQFSRAVFVV